MFNDTMRNLSDEVFSGIMVYELEKKCGRNW
jgi:hypothetical protein